LTHFKDKIAQSASHQESDELSTVTSNQSNAAHPQTTGKGILNLHSAAEPNSRKNRRTEDSSLLKELFASNGWILMKQAY
jgi:hypothetical protein